jgi:hypothetical protein
VTNIVNDNLGNITVGNNLTVAGASTLTGNVAASGTLTVGGTAVVAAAPTAIGNIPFSTNGTTWSSTAKIVQGTAQASTSGTSITFSSIPSWAKRITVMFTGVSTNGSSNVTVRVGSGSVQTTGYTGVGMEVVSTNQVGGLNLSSGFTIRSQAGASDVYNGAYILSYFGSNTWVCTATIGLSSTIRGMIVGGYVTLSGTLDRVSITTESGTDTFDAGSINILYE